VDLQPANDFARCVEANSLGVRIPKSERIFDARVSGQSHAAPLREFYNRLRVQAR
jgi:hypothetical protein